MCCFMVFVKKFTMSKWKPTYNPNHQQLHVIVKNINTHLSKFSSQR